MQSMFQYCSSLTELDLSNFNTDCVNNMNAMFEGCVKIEKLSLSNFTAHRVGNIGLMFNNCSSLKELDLSNFISDNIFQSDETSSIIPTKNEIISPNISANDYIYAKGMFKGCKKLKKFKFADIFVIKEYLKLFISEN